jgi:hypothetical protein
MFDLDFLKTCTAGFGRMTDEAQAVLRQTVSLAQRPDGLFPDRSGHGDLYYTLFGLCLAYVSGATVDRDACARMLEHAAPADLVHRAALAHSRNLLKLMALPRAMRNLPLPAPKLDFPDLPDAAFPQGDRNSPYSCFLRNDTATDLGAYRLPDGLYSNLKGASEYGVAATAAALCLHPGETTAAALAGLQKPDGTFPGGDLLSTAVSLYALHRTGHAAKYDVREFLGGCFRPTGLFAAVPADPFGDLEYTVYGLLAMGATA